MSKTISDEQRIIEFFQRADEGDCHLMLEKVNLVMTTRFIVPVKRGRPAGKRPMSPKAVSDAQ